MRRIILLFFVALSPIFSLPVTKTTKKPAEVPTDLQHNLEYERYLKEIVEALESDADFRKKLNEASEDDIRSGNIAHELEYVNHQVRTKLDEIKREEIERLRSLVKKQYQLSNNIDEDHLKITSLGHVDHENVHTFEIKDLQKLISKVSEDLSAADKARREEFKQYELEKEFEKQEKLRGYGDDSRAQHEAEMQKLQQKHNEHEKVHHPGNKAQLEEVWEEQDHMKGVDFDPQTFFMMHDVDSNGVWDQNEVKALFIKELDKVYQQGLPEDDMRERAEEMERMREHVFSESDRNKDGVIDYKEFIEQTKRDEYIRDDGWDTVDTEKVYTHEEYLEFERRRQEEIQRMMAEHPERYPNYHQNMQHHQNNNQHLDQQHVNQQQQYHNQQQQVPQQQQYQNQAPPQHQQQYQGQNQQQPPQYNNQQQQQYPNQVPQQQQYQQQNNQNAQQNNNQQFQQAPPQQQQQYQQQNNQHAQQNNNQQFQQPPSQQQQQYQQQNNQNAQQNNQNAQQNNQNAQQNNNQQFQQPPPQQQQQQQQPPQEQPTQQKPLSQSSNFNQIDSNQANSKVQNSVEQKPIQPQVIQPQH